MIFGVPVDPEVAIALAGRGTRSGTGSDEYSEASSTELCRMGALVTPSQSPITTVGRATSRHALPFPFGEVPPQRQDAGTRLPRAVHGDDMGHGVRQGGDHRRALAHTMMLEEPGDPIRSLVELVATDVVLGAALFDENEGTVFGTFGRHL